MFILKFAESSAWPGDYVALDSASGGYPYSVGQDILRAEIWDTEDKALDYAASFQGGNSYRPYEIIQKVFKVTITVEGDSNG